MKSSYKPFLLLEEDRTPVTIVRLAPSRTAVEIQFLSDESSFEVCVTEGDMPVKSVQTHEKQLTVDGLKPNRTYVVSVKCPAGESGRRRFVTGDYLGTVVNYLHPDDPAYAFSGRFLATPSLVRFREKLYVSMDVFCGGNDRGAYNLTLLYRSADNGITWEYVTDLVPAFWGTLFVARDKLCLLAVDTEVGSLLVMSSEDGENFGDPTYLRYGCGHRVGCGNHKSATPCLERNGKLYFALEYGGYGVKRFDTLVATVDLSKDICDKSAWVFSESARVEFDWWQGSDQSIRFAIEGNMVERNGELFVVSRYAYHRALLWRFDPSRLTKAPVMEKILDFEPGHCKFHIQKAEDGTYYAMGNTGCYPRHVLRLYRSRNLEEWETVATLEDISELSAEKDGVQYPGFFIENGCLHTVLRNALNGAHTFHDSNAIVYKTYSLPSEKI